MKEFECQRCGKCCNTLKLEIVEIDLIREPRLRAVAKPISINNENPFENTYLLPSPCVFYNNKCMIHDTRPNLCVAFSEKCLNKKKRRNKNER